MCYCIEGFGIGIGNDSDEKGNDSDGKGNDSDELNPKVSRNFRSAQFSAKIGTD